MRPLRLAVLADIHGNLVALEAVLAELGRVPNLTGIVVAGDHLTAGPAPAATLRRLRELGATLIAGNGEGYLLGLRDGSLPGWTTGRHWAAVRWTYRQLAASDLDFIAGLPKQTVFRLDGAAPVRVLHGSPLQAKDRLYPDRDPAALKLFRAASLLGAGEQPRALEERLAGVTEPVLVCAHTHIPWQQAWTGGRALNPGSVGAPHDGSPWADYALLTWQDDRWRVELCSVPYDLAAARAAYQASGFLPAAGPFARACLRNTETGCNFLGRFVALGHSLAAEAGQAAGDVLPDDIWQQAEAIFDWNCATRSF